MSDVVARLADAVGPAGVLAGADVPPDRTHDECLTVAPVAPVALVLPTHTEQVADVLRIAHELHVPVTARGAATGMSGACVPEPDGIVLSFERMADVVDLDTANHAAVVQPGLTLAALDAELAPHGLVYPVFPGESSASIGGNVATNAGGMRAVKYGVTRQHVLGLEFVLPGGTVLRSGGKTVKVSSGYDLTQLLIGSEGTLAVFTEVTLRLHPRLPRTATLLAPFPDVTGVVGAVPRLVGSGLDPMVLEYVDMVTMAAITEAAELNLGIPADVRAGAAAYLLMVLEARREDRLEQDVEEAGSLLAELGASDVYVLPDGAGEQLVAARERAFWVAKAAGADDIVDVVVPRASVPAYLAEVGEIAQRHASIVAGCGHAGDGNVHLSVFQPDPAARKQLLLEIFRAGRHLGGAVSGEHGLGRAKRQYFLELADAEQVALLRRIKDAFDPHGILAPSVSL